MILAHLGDSEPGSTLLVVGVGLALWGWRRQRPRMVVGGLVVAVAGFVVSLLHDPAATP